LYLKRVKVGESLTKLLATILNDFQKRVHTLIWVEPRVNNDLLKKHILHM